MAIYKCKMCGGDLEIAEGLTIAECEYCGTKQTVPKAADESLQNLFNRANTLRIKSEFDKAEKLYEKIIQADETQAEAYWGLILCKYGIEYVDDPVTFKKIPTCHRASYDSIIADEDYKAALENADAGQRSLYEEQAREIDRIQRDILALAQREETYDVFICYKETDASGHRTQDSVIANDIYYQLTQEGFKVFYAAITLEGKLGSAYEPIIFAALNSAKVMLSIGTKPEYFNAVWVKNEWSRFLKIIKKDRSKLLIPCYRDMDAYELPEEFAHLQAQDMSKIGFINDLVRGIKKVIQKDEPKQSVVKETVVATGNANTAPLLKRAFMFLEDGDWNSANEYCEKVLDIDPENAQAYLGKLMAELRTGKREDLKDCELPFDGNGNYQKAVRFADEGLKNTLVGYIEHINTRNENARLEGIYTRAQKAMAMAQSDRAFYEAAQIFDSISDYMDSVSLAEECRNKAEDARKDAIYVDGRIQANNSGNSISRLEGAIKTLQKVSGWKDADELLTKCQSRVEEIKAKAEADRLECERKAEIARQKAERRAKRNKKIAIIVSAVVVVCIAIAALWFFVLSPLMRYNEAQALFENGEYDAAVEVFAGLGDYRDSADKILEVKYEKADKLFEAKKYDEAFAGFIVLGNYNNAAEKSKEVRYTEANDYMTSGDYEKAADIFLSVKEYKDSHEQYFNAILCHAKAMLDAESYTKVEDDIKILISGNRHEEETYSLIDQVKEAYYNKEKYVDAFRVYKLTKDYSVDAKEFKDIAYKAGESLLKDGEYSAASVYYNLIKGYSDSNKKILECDYQMGIEALKAKRYSTAIYSFEKAGSHKDSKTQLKEAKYQFVLANRNRSNTDTLNYLKELKSAKYKDSAAIYTELFGWKAEIIANDDEDNSTRDMTSITKYSNWYFHIKVSGGEPNAETKIKYTAYFPNGEKKSGSWDDKWKSGWSGTCWFWYNNPAYGKQGTFKLKVYDGNGSLIGEKSIKITG